MKQIGRWVALLGVTLAVTGCGTQPTQVDHYQMYLPEFPSLLVVHTPVAPPPDRSAYLGANTDQQKTMLMNAYLAQTANVMTCNIDKDNVASWYAKQQTVVDQANAATAASGVQAKQ